MNQNRCYGPVSLNLYFRCLAIRSKRRSDNSGEALLSSAMKVFDMLYNVCIE